MAFAAACPFACRGSAPQEFHSTLLIGDCMAAIVRSDLERNFSVQAAAYIPLRFQFLAGVVDYYPYLEFVRELGRVSNPASRYLLS